MSLEWLAFSSHYIRTHSPTKRFWSRLFSMTSYNSKTLHQRYGVRITQKSPVWSTGYYCYQLRNSGTDQISDIYLLQFLGPKIISSSFILSNDFICTTNEILQHPSLNVIPWEWHLFRLKWNLGELWMLLLGATIRKELDSKAIFSTKYEGQGHVSPIFVDILLEMMPRDLWGSLNMIGHQLFAAETAAGKTFLDKTRHCCGCIENYSRIHVCLTLFALLLNCYSNIYYEWRHTYFVHFECGLVVGVGWVL